MARKWSEAKIARVEAQAVRLGELQTRVMAHPLFPAVVVVLAVLVMGLAIGGLEHSL